MAQNIDEIVESEMRERLWKRELHAARTIISALVARMGGDVRLAAHELAEQDESRLTISDSEHFDGGIVVRVSLGDAPNRGADRGEHREGSEPTGQKP